MIPIFTKNSRRLGEALEHSTRIKNERKNSSRMGNLFEQVFQIYKNSLIKPHY